jgi:hypothetical protein
VVWKRSEMHSLNIIRKKVGKMVNKKKEEKADGTE